MRLFSAQQVSVVVVEGSVITVMNPDTSRGNARKDETAAVADSAAADAEAVAAAEAAAEAFATIVNNRDIL